MGRGQQDEIDEELDELEHSLKRLRVEYDQYFLGILKRPPEVLQGRIQKVIVKYANETLRKTHHKFRFNQLNSKFQIHRQQWGRTMRQIEAGTYKGHLFKAKLHERERGISDETRGQPSCKAPEPTDAARRDRQALRRAGRGAQARGRLGPRARPREAVRDREEADRRAEAEAPGREGEVPGRDRGQQGQAGRSS